MAASLVPLMNERNRKIFDDDGGADFAHTFDVDGVRLAVPREPACSSSATSAWSPAA